ncbi:hypothetical protein PO909_000994 [Leuciscus waleckii]
MGNSRVVKSPSSLEECGSRAQAVRGGDPTISSWYLSTSRTISGSFPASEVTFHVPRASFRVQGSGCRGPRLQLPPDPLSTGPLRSLLQVVSPREGGPTSLLWAEPGRTSWGEARPPGARIRAPTPGLAPRWGPGCAMLGDVTVLDFKSIIKGFRTVLSLTRTPRTCLP